MENIKVTNPKGETREFDENGYLNLKLQTLNSHSFSVWCETNEISGTFQHEGSSRVNHQVIEKFLELKGYKIEKD